MDIKTQNKVDELVNLFASTLRDEAERLYRSGALDIISYDKNQYKLAKILVSASIKRRENDLNDSDLMDDIENLTVI